MNDLRHFYAVATHQGFSRAARARRFQQATLSRSVKNLEEQLGTRLFARSTRSVVLTSAGQRLFEECRKLFEQLDQLAGKVNATNAELEGILQFGISDSLAPSVLPAVLREFKREHPKVIPSVATGSAPQMLRKLELGELEFGIFFANPSRLFPLAVAPIAAIPFFLMVSTRYRRDRTVLANLIAAREVEDGRGEEESRDAEIVRAAAPAASIAFSANSYPIHKELVRQGLGISFFPRFMVLDELRRKTFTILNHNFPFTVPLNLIVPKARPLSARADALVQKFLGHPQLQPGSSQRGNVGQVPPKR